MSDKSTLQFLSGGGEMGRLIREKDWSNSIVGEPANWPQSLRTTLSIILNSKFPMFLFWGPELICFYNDAYRPSLGNDGKHPDILGARAENFWVEIWQEIKPIIDQVLGGGEASWNEDMLLPIFRNGKIEDVYWTFSYSPVMDESGKPAGVFVTCIDTTRKVNTLQSLAHSEERFWAMADNIPNLAWMAHADGWIYWYNKKWYDYTGTTAEEMAGWGWQKVHHPEMVEQVVGKWQRSIDLGIPFEMVFPIKGADGNYRQFLTRVLPLRNTEGKIIRWFGSNTDITTQIETEEALKETEQRFRNTVHQAPVGITILRGKEYKVEMANAAYLKIVDRKEKEFVGKPLFESLPEVKNTVHNLLDNVLDTGIPFHGYEVPVPLNRDGNLDTFYFDFLYYPLSEEDGRISGIIVTVTEVTEKIESRLKTKQNEERLKIVVEASELGTWELNMKTREPKYSQRYLEILGGYKETVTLTHEQLIKHLHPDDLYIREKAFREALKTGYLHYEARLIWNDNSIHWMEGRGKVFFDEENRPEKMIGTVRDITQEKNHQQELIESEQKFRLLADSMPQHIWTSDTEGNLNYFNKSVFDYSGLTAEEVYDGGWIQIIHPDDREANLAEWMKSITSGNDFLFEHRFRKHDGTYRWQLSRAIPQKDENGEIQMWVGTSTDIQDQKSFAEELEMQVKERTRELAQNNVDLENMNKELQSFAYISSHDLQEPLRKIQTFSTQIIEKELHNLSDFAVDKFQKMQNSAQRMQTLINDLLSYSRTNIQERKFENTDLNEIVTNVKDDLKEELLQKNATIETNEMCELKIIPFQFRQLIFNLVNNALKFSKEDEPPHIKITSEVHQGRNFDIEKLDHDITYCHLQISDNGIGFESQYSEKIFGVFQRLHGKGEYTGTGIGLAIVKKIVENHNGVITADGKVNEGATFDIYIPVSQ